MTNENLLEPAERFKAFLALSEQSEQKMHTRRAIEWKLKLGLWVGVILVTGALLKVPDIASKKLPITLFYVFVAIFDLLWTWSVQRSHHVDQMFHLHFRSMAEKLAGVLTPLEERYPTRKDLGHLDAIPFIWRWVALLWIPTVTLLIVSWLVLFGVASS